MEETMNGFYKNRIPIIVETSKYGVTIMPEPVYKFPKGHPCHGCVFIFQTSKPSCITGSYPDSDNCINTFHKKLLAKHEAERKMKSQQDTLTENK